MLMACLWKSRRSCFFFTLLSYTWTTIKIWFSDLPRIRATFPIVGSSDCPISETLANITQRIPRPQTTDLQNLWLEFSEFLTHTRLSPKMCEFDRFHKINFTESHFFICTILRGLFQKQIFKFYLIKYLKTQKWNKLECLSRDDHIPWLMYEASATWKIETFSK